MPLQKQTVTVPILGLDTHVDPKTAPPGTLTLAENVVYRRSAQGALEVIKRNGFLQRTANVVPTGTVTTGRKLATYNDEQLIIGSDSIYSWSPAVNKWTKRMAQANLPACTVTAMPVGSQVRGTVNCWDQAVGGGLICTVWGQGTNQPSHVTVVDATTGTHILDQDLGWSTATGVREIHVVALASVFMIVASFETTGNLSSKAISFSSPTSISAENALPAVLISASGRNHFDVVRAGTNDWCIVAAHTTTPNMTFIRWNSSQTSGGTSTSAEVGDLGFSWLTWDASDGNMYLAYTNLANGTKIYPVNVTTAAVGAAVVADATWKDGSGITGYRIGTTNILFAGSILSGALNPTISRWGGSGAFSTFQRGVAIYGRPFTNGRTYLPCISTDNGFASRPTGGVVLGQRTFFLLDVGDSNSYNSPVAAKAFFGEAGNQSNNTTFVSTSVIASNKVTIPVVRQAAPNAINDLATGVLAPGVGIFEPNSVVLDFTLPSCSPATIGSESLYLPGGALKEYDNATLAEAEFHLIPIAPTLTAGAAGGLTASTTYQAVVVWAYTDNRGNTHYSAPSQAASITLTAGQTSLTAACQTYRLSERATSCWVELYLTAGNGFIFYLASRAANDPTVDSVSFNSASPATISDATLTVQPQLYTTDGTLAHVPLPPAKFMCAYRNRLLLAGTEDPCDIWVSNERISGQGVSFSDANIVQVDKEGGPITGIIEFDDRVIIFKRSAVFEMAGPGPALNGSGGFDLPTRLTATIGCAAIESVVKTPQGLIFQSPRGFYILPPGGGLPIRMRAIEGFETLTVTGAASLDSVEQVRFTTSAGTTLVYHYGFLDEQGQGRWAVHTNQVAVDCAVLSGAFAYLNASGQLNLETATWDDNGAAIQARVQFAWLNLAGIYGRHRLYQTAVEAEWLATFTANLRHAVNYISTPVQTATAAATSSSLIPLVLPNTRGDAYSHQFTLDETSTTQGFKASALALELAGKGSMAKPLAGQTFT